MDKLYRLPEVLKITGMCKATIYSRIKTGDFPAPVVIFKGGRAVGWRSDALTAWLVEHIS